MTKTHERKRRGFTLVEVLIVVVILGILAATVLPQFSAANDDAMESAIVQDLQTLRSQIEVYRFQHEGVFPGQGSTDEQDFLDALLLSSNTAGTTGAIGTLPLGPYFVGQLPPNPYNGLRSVSVTTTDITTITPDDSTGWIYNSSTGRIKANTPAATVDANGTPIHQL